MIKIFTTNLIKLQDVPNLSNIPQNVIGIDVGQSLTKIAYLIEDDLILSIHPTLDDYEYINKYLVINNLTNMKLNLTGGKAYYFQKQLSKNYRSSIFNEFEANVNGIDILFKIEKSKSLPASLIITIGTGSSMILKKENSQYEHLGGSALGGGFFMALIKLLFNINSFDKAIDLAQQGDRYKVDLKVADIYSPEDQRVNAIFREFTAASLGKINTRGNFENYNKQDLLNSLISMIGENLGTIAIEKANYHNIKDLIFCGGFLSNNKPVKKILSLLCRYNQKKALFLEQSMFTGAIGILFI